MKKCGRNLPEIRQETSTGLALFKYWVVKVSPGASNGSPALEMALGIDQVFVSPLPESA